MTNSERSLYFIPMMTAKQNAISMTCEACNVRCQSIGKHRNGLRRFRCPVCRKSYTEPHRRTLDTMYISQEKATLALQLLLEGNSLRSTQPQPRAPMWLCAIEETVERVRLELC